MLTETICKKLISTRKEKGLTQKELATRCGLSRVWVSMIERGKADHLTFGCLEKIVKALGLRLSIKITRPISKKSRNGLDN